jgi:WXG100 family type VII secretion target
MVTVTFPLFDRSAPMSNGSFDVTPAQLQAIASRLASEADGLKERDAALRALVAPLRSEWSGQAAASFEGLWDQWSRSTDLMHDALEGISRLMDTTGVSYAVTDDGVRAGFGGV